MVGREERRGRPRKSLGAVPPLRPHRLPREVRLWARGGSEEIHGARGWLYLLGSTWCTTTSRDKDRLNGNSGGTAEEGLPTAYRPADPSGPDPKILGSSNLHLHDVGVEAPCQPSPANCPMPLAAREALRVQPGGLARCRVQLYALSEGREAAREEPRACRAAVVATRKSSRAPGPGEEPETAFPCPFRTPHVAPVPQVMA